MSKKVYLSLDDLNKLFGLSNTVINAIKKKRKKRRNKKLKKINNGSMGNKPSPSDHMVGSSNALSIATQQLNNAMVNKRIEDINRNNLMIENKKVDIPLEVQIYNKLKNKEMLTPNELQAYEEIQNVMLPKPPTKPKRTYIRRKTFPVPEIIKPNALSSLSQSNVMGREESFNNIQISPDDSVGSNVGGTSSDQFINNNTEEFMMAPAVDQSLTVDTPPEIPEIPEIVDENNEQSVEYMSIDDFNLKELKKIAKENNMTGIKKMDKEKLYNMLFDLEYIPVK